MGGQLVVAAQSIAFLIPGIYFRIFDTPEKGRLTLPEKGAERRQRGSGPPSLDVPGRGRRRGTFQAVHGDLLF